MGVLSRPLRRVLVLLCLLLAELTAAAPSREISEQELKAAALYQVLHFVRLPSSRSDALGTPFVIGIYGGNPFDTVLDEVMSGASVGGRSVAVKEVFTAEGAGECDVVYVAGGDDRTTVRLASMLARRGVLTVGEGERFVENGGMIAFAVRNDRIRMLVNLEAARRANITLSSKLLRLAEIVQR